MEEYGSFFELYLVKKFNSFCREKNYRKILNLDMILKLEYVYVCWLVYIKKNEKVVL